MPFNSLRVCWQTDKITRILGENSAKGVFPCPQVSDSLRELLLYRIKRYKLIFPNCCNFFCGFKNPTLVWYGMVQYGMECHCILSTCYSPVLSWPVGEFFTRNVDIGMQRAFSRVTCQILNFLEYSIKNKKNHLAHYCINNYHVWHILRTKPNASLVFHYR